MSYSHRLFTRSNKKFFDFIPQPALAWIVISVLTGVTVLGIVAGAGSILRFAFPIGALAVGLILFKKYPVFYLSFTFWLYFLTPLIRRLIDYQSGWVNPSPVLLAPPLVALITLITLVRYLPKAHRWDAIPYALAFAAILYAFCIGIIRSSPVAATRDLINWITPLSLGFHLLVNWRDYPLYRQNLQRTFLWGVLVMGSYGVVQYLVAPEWDCLWLIESGMTSSNGSPEPLGIRVWSTMNSAGPFAITMMAGLIILLSNESFLRLPASGLGYLSFLLSLARSAWGAWLVAIIVFSISLKSKFQLRLIITLLLVALATIPLATMEPFSERIGNRLESFSNLEEDGSARERVRLYQRHLNQAIFNYQGNGIGGAFTLDASAQPIAVAIDSGFIALFNTLGWFGGIPYISAVALLIWKLFQINEVCFDKFISCSRALCVALLSLMIFVNSLAGIGGIVFWVFSTLALAGHKYYNHHHYSVK